MPAAFTPKDPNSSDTTANLRNLTVLAMKDPPHSLYKCLPQMIELNENYATVPSKKPEVLHPLQLVPSQPSLGESLSLPSQSRKMRRGDCSLKYRHQHKGIKNTHTKKKQETDTTKRTQLLFNVISGLSEKEFKKNYLRKLSETQENTDRQFNELRKTV